MHYALIAKLGIAAALTVGLASPATAIANEQPPAQHAVSATVTSNSAGDITLP